MRLNNEKLYIICMFLFFFFSLCNFKELIYTLEVKESSSDRCIAI